MKEEKKMTALELNRKFGGRSAAGTAFNAGNIDRNGRDRAKYTGCCDAAKDARITRPKHWG